MARILVQEKQLNVVEYDDLIFILVMLNLFSELTPHDRPQVMTTLDHSGCCVYQGQYFNVGERIPLPNKCAWLSCR